MAYAKELGLVFNQEDLEALAREAGIGQSDELSEEDLERVASGFLTVTALTIAASRAIDGATVGASAAKHWQT